MDGAGSASVHMFSHTGARRGGADRVSDGLGVMAGNADGRTAARALGWEGK